MSALACKAGFRPRRDARRLDAHYRGRPSCRSHYRKYPDDAEKGSTKKSPVSIRDLVREVVASVAGELKTHRVSLKVELYQELPRVVADRVQLQQVFLNLIMNALEAMSSVENGDRSLLVKSELRGTRNVLIRVEDSGPGIDPNDVERIFDAFFTTKSQGMGLGLSICQSIIEAHGGQLWASTRNPHGAVFCVELPSGQ